MTSSAGSRASAIAGGAGTVEERGSVGAEITEVTDEDYRCVWRPCEALEEPAEAPEDALAGPGHQGVRARSG